MNRGGDLNTKVEYATAANFVEWYNITFGQKLALLRKQESPDFIYADAIGEIGLEVTTAYYNQDDAKILAETGRGKRRTYSIQEIVDAPKEINYQTVWEPEMSLVHFLNKLTMAKCSKHYGASCILVIRVPKPALTTRFEFEHEVVPNVSVPAENSFNEIFLTADQRRYFKLA